MNLMLVDKSAIVHVLRLNTLGIQVGKLIV